ncbi:ovochymase-2-like isoform X1 [Eriocheir sinensis]|uniref:ovochymase-2-like isoform X1 n=1 Tax=Eriocheir sinensis TaxID=95602 RepID=UPI0021C772B9|nr:ovochymase-2-like isoform X1 [Eriocheir sinensis]
MQHNATMRCFLLSLAASFTFMWGGCYARDLPLHRELPVSSLHLIRGNGSHVQPKDGHMRGNGISVQHIGDTRQSALECSDYTMSAGGYAVIQSENYPDNYPNSHNCYWTFETTDDSTISFSCDDFDVRSSSDCRRDFMDLTDFATINYRFCGTGYIEPITDMEGFVQIRFRTNRRGTARGFSCEIWASSDVTTGSTTEAGSSESTASSEGPTESNSTNEPPSDDCNCGVRNTASRIVGGEETTLHEYPWQVALVSKSGNRPYCGGSIISNQWILTAAHCVDRNTVSDTDIVIGEHDWSTSSDTSATERKSLSQAIRHPSYSSQALDNDIALLQLAEPITFPSNNKIAPVCLATPDNLYEAVQATITGWGTLKSGGSQPYKLNEVTVPTMTNAACKATGYDDDEITANMICAGVSEGGKDSCQGDSGGPMVTGSGSMQQIGVVSWGYGCADQRYPGVYTRVSNYVSWIEGKIAGSQTCTPAA